MSNSATIDDEISLCVARASASFGRLRDCVGKRRLSFETKLHVYRLHPSSMVQSPGLFTPASCKSSSPFHMRCLRQILHVKWQERIPDTEVIQRSNSVSIGSMLNPKWPLFYREITEITIKYELIYLEL